MAVSHRLLLLIIWGFMALITLMIFGTSVSADEHLPTAGEILQNGKTLHKEVYLLRDANLVGTNLAALVNYKTQISQITYHVMYKEEYYLCFTMYETYGFSFPSIRCKKSDQDTTWD